MYRPPAEWLLVIAQADLGNAEKSQQNYVFQAPLANGETAYVWTGDR